MVVVAALAVMMMLMLVVVVVAALAVMMMLMLVVIVVAALAVMVMLMLFVIVMAALAVVVMLMLVVVVMAALAVVVMMLVRFFRKFVHFCLKSGFSFHSLKKLCAGELFPRSGNDYRGSIMIFQKGDAISDLLVGHFTGMAEDDTTCVFYLVVEEFTKIFHVHFALVGINNGSKAVELSAFCVSVLYRLDHVGELAHAGGLNEDTVGSILVDHLFQSDCKVSDKRAADATRIHFIDLNSRLCKKSSVDSDLTEFIFDENDLFTLVCFFNQFFNKGGLSRSEKTGKNIDLCHNNSLS